MTPPRGPCWEVCKVGISPYFNLRLCTAVGSTLVSVRMTKSVKWEMLELIAANFGPLQVANSPLIPHVFWARMFMHFVISILFNKRLKGDLL